MTVLGKITTSYSEGEDRLRLDGEDAASGAALVLWLTQRLAGRLVRTLAQWLEQEDGGKLAPLAPVERQLWAQEAALQQWQPATPVLAAADAPEFLVTSVDLAQDAGRYIVVFRGAAGNPAPQLSFSSVELRQWLGIVRSLYRAAGWPQDPWPNWLAEPAAEAAAPHPFAYH